MKVCETAFAKSPQTSDKSNDFNSLRYFCPVFRGRRYLLNAGSEGFAYYYGQRTFLSFQVSFNDKELYLCIEDKEWQHIEIQPINLSEFSQDTFDELNTVVGSNVIGKAETHMELISHCCYSKILSLDEQRQVKNELTKHFNQKEIKIVNFEGNQFLHSQNHPNFGKAS